MRIIIASLAMIFFAGCNNGPKGDNNGNMAVKEEATDKDHKEPVFNGSIDTLKLKGMLDNYLTLKNALIDGNAEAASSTGTKAFKEMPNESDEVLRQISENFKHIGETKDLEMQRTFFYPLSEYVYAVTIKIKPDNHTLYKQYCPMAFDEKGAWWISDDEEVVNPYFGEEMLNCGMVQKSW